MTSSMTTPNLAEPWHTEQGGEMSNVAAAHTQAVTRPLKVLIPAIKDEIAQGDAAGVEFYRRAGEMLLEAKEQLTHGEWTPWLKRNFTLCPRTARDYMALAARLIGENGSALPFSTLSEFTQPDRATHHRPVWQEPVREITSRVNMEAIVAHERSRVQEQRLQQALGRQLIDIGYKVLCTKLHPDKGGSTEAMARLNRVRSRLRAAR